MFRIYAYPRVPSLATVPTATATLVMTGFAVAAMDSKKLASHGRVDPPDVGVLAAFVYAVFGTLVALPAAIITYRYAAVF